MTKRQILLPNLQPAAPSRLQVHYVDKNLFFNNCPLFCCRKRVASSTEELREPASVTSEKVAKMSVKKMINEVDNVVDEALDALVRTNPGVNIIENHRVIVRSDVENVKDKVAILCGGGSGHEPAFAGYVGKGCLSAAVAGSVFASPPPKSILAGLLTLAKLNPSGILVVCTNRLFMHV